MRKYLLTLIIVTAALCVIACPDRTVWAQVQIGAQPATAAAPTLPVTTQIKKTVVFLEADCLHDFGPEIAQLTPDAMAKILPPEMAARKQQYGVLIARLEKLSQSKAKLTSHEISLLRPEILGSLELLQIANLAAKMAGLTPEDIGELTAAEIATLPTDSFLGTGFMVLVPDDRIPLPAGVDRSGTGFGYLVTNRHVVQPGIEDGKPCQILAYSVVLNRKGNSATDLPRAESIGLGNRVNWHFSQNDSVDLAVTAFLPPPQIYDFFRIPVGLFTTQEMGEKKLVVEGDPVLFSGLFIQSFRELHSLEPIVRSGTLAMVPNGPLETTLHKPGRVYLTEAHAFAGNSGSPVFIDTNRFANIVGGPSYTLLGVISGEILETSDLTLHVTTSYSASLGANSDVSMVVPASEIKGILYSPHLQADRDAFVAELLRAK
jgi:hypothetical protein